MSVKYPDIPRVSSPPPGSSPGPILDPRNAHILSTPQNKYTTYDFSPFIYAPAIQQRISTRQQIPLVPIPNTRIPSPLAENLHPSVIKDIHDFLLGTGVYSTPYCRNYSGNGVEVWASWKRAWDLWNNHFIKGRVNEVWIAGAYKKWEAYVKQQARKGKGPFEGPGGRRKLRRKRTRIGMAYRTEKKALEQLEAFLDVVAQGREDFKERALNNLKNTLKRNRGLGNGYIGFSEETEEWRRKNWFAPKWDEYKDYKNKAPEYLPLTMQYVNEELYEDLRERVRELLEVDFWKKEPILENHPGTIEYAIAVAKWEQQPEVRRCRVTERPYWLELQPVQDREQIYIQSAIKRTSPAVMEEFKERMKANRKLGVGYIEYSWQEAHYNINVKSHQGTIDPALQALEKPDPADYIDKAFPGKADEGTGPVTAIDREEDDEDHDEDDNDELDPNDFTRPLPIEEDGQSGGWRAMKDFEEYAVPDEDDATFVEYDDPIENSVWRPIQVGEEELKIDMDEDIEEFLQNSEFEIDGGVDCGRSPYPLLRPLYRYAQSQVDVPNPPAGPQFSVQKHGSLLKLKKSWDEVTGTVFNIPTKDISQQTLDKAANRFHRESFESSSNYQNPDIFPLDIRRCKKILSPFKSENWVPEKAPDANDNDIIIEPSFKMKEKEYRAMRIEDPWWVDAQQKKYRDLPPRNHPPNFDEQLSELPKDVKLWKDEVLKDSDSVSRYFVTNLDGRHLSINGIEIAKGEIGGPLPEFAVIQTEGGGVSFWFGVGGRFYLQPADARGKDWSRQWTLLRQALSDEYFGVTSGYYWQNEIVARILEDDEGEGEQDPKWIKWKGAKAAGSTREIPNRSHSTQDEDWAAPGPLPFDSPEAELKWVAAQLHFQTMHTNEPYLKAEMIEPTTDTAWGGLEDNYHAASDGPSDEARNDWWRDNRSQYQKVQIESGQKFEEMQHHQEDEDRAADEAASLKRKADHDGYFPPDAKRFRDSIEEKQKEKIEQIEKEEERQLDRELQELIGQVTQGVEEIAEGAGGQGRPPGDGHPATGTEADTQAWETLQRVRELERRRILFNEQRKGANNITIPPMKDPIAGLAPSKVLTLPENRWALEAIVKQRDNYRLDQEVQETAALNNLNASERLKRKRLARRRNKGTIGFSVLKDEEREAQQNKSREEAKLEKQGKQVKEIIRSVHEYNAKLERAKKDKQNAAAIKEGVKAGDIAKAQAAADKSQKDVEIAKHIVAAHVAINDWAKANNVTEMQVLHYMVDVGKPFDPIECSEWANKAATENIKQEIVEAAHEKAKKQGMRIDTYLRQVEGVQNMDRYVEKALKYKIPPYILNENAQEGRRLYREALLRYACGPAGSRLGGFTNWEEMVSTMPCTDDWDGLINSDPSVEPTEFGLLPRHKGVNMYPGGDAFWTGDM